MKRRSNRSGTLFRRGDVWYYKLKAGGKWEVRSTGTGDKDKARAVLDKAARGYGLTDDERLAAIAARLRKSQEPAAPTFAEAWERYENAPANVAQTEGAQNTDAGRWRVFARWLHGHDGGPRCRVNCAAAHPEARTLADITPAIAAEFVRHAQGTNAPNTVNKYVRVLRRVWRLCGVEPSPWADFRKIAEPPHLRRALTGEEVGRLIGAARGELRVLFAVGAYTGLRLGDAAHLRWGDFDEGLETLTLRPRKTTHSSGVAVAVPVHPALARALREGAKNRARSARRRTGYIVPALAALAPWALSRRVVAHFRACGFEAGERPEGYGRSVPIVGFHSLRSTFITAMANVGAPLAMVQAIVGHMSPEMSMHYYRASADAARARVEALPDYLRG